LTQRIDSLFYPDTTRYWDDERFVEIVKTYLQPDFRILDFGAGRGKANILNFRQQVDRVVGVDVSNDILQNQNVDEKHVVDPCQPLPFDDASFNLVYSCNVLEHVADPVPIFQEIRRVLKPGGIFLSKTSNKNHYVAWVARMSPLWFHKSVNRLRQRESIDTFPTFYRCNSRRQVRSLARDCGLELERLEFLEWRPEYLRITPVTYVGGIAYEKVVNSSSYLAPLRAVMVVGLRNPA
jgi:ubiquinone/menaquinone biosynthesis C-methylase UbiE